MNSESGRRLSTEELKRLIQSSKATPPPMVLLREADWEELLTRLNHLEASVGAQEALLRVLSQQVGQLPHPGAGGGPGAGCGPNACGVETGWEEERALYLAAQSPDRAVGLDLAGSDPAGDHRWHGGLAGDLVRLGRTLEGGPDIDPVRDVTTMHQHADRKLRQKERQKKIALGHKADDHEDEIDLTMKGY